MTTNRLSCVGSAGPSMPVGTGCFLPQVHTSVHSAISSVALAHVLQRGAADLQMLHEIYDMPTTDPPTAWVVRSVTHCSGCLLHGQQGGWPTSVMLRR